MVSWSTQSCRMVHTTSLWTGSSGAAAVDPRVEVEIAELKDIVVAGLASFFSFTTSSSLLCRRHGDVTSEPVPDIFGNPDPYNSLHMHSEGGLLLGELQDFQPCQGSLCVIFAAT